MDDPVAAFDQEWKTGDRAKAKEMAKAWVEANAELVMPNLEAGVRALREARLSDPVAIPDLVALVSAYRAQGREADRIMVDMVLLAGYEPQSISGTIQMNGSAAVEAVQALLAGR